MSNHPRSSKGGPKPKPESKSKGERSKKKNLIN